MDKRYNYSSDIINIMTEMRASLTREENETCYFCLISALNTMSECISLHFNSLNGTSNEPLFTKPDICPSSTLEIAKLCRDLSMMLLNSINLNSQLDLIDGIFKSKALYLNALEVDTVLRLLQCPDDDSFYQYQLLAGKCLRKKKNLESTKMTMSNRLKLTNN